MRKIVRYSYKITQLLILLWRRILPNKCDSIRRKKKKDRWKKIIDTDEVEGRRKKKATNKKEEGRRKKEEGRKKKEEGRRKKEEGRERERERREMILYNVLVFNSSTMANYG